MRTSLARVWMLSVVLFSACGSDEAEDACTAIGCSNGFTLNFNASSWAPGKYRIELVVDGVDGTCEATLPLTSTSKSTCTLPDVQLGLSGSALPAAEQGLVGLMWTSLPKEVEIKMFLDDNALGQPWSFEPMYQTTQPNGATCGPTCTNASDTWALLPVYLCSSMKAYG